VVAEFALSLVLLTAAGLLGKSLLLLGQVHPGFRTDHLLTVEVYRSMSDRSEEANWKNWTGFYQQLLARIAALSGVESAGATLALPVRDAFGTPALKSTAGRSGVYLSSHKPTHESSPTIILT
jgi:putative ABC transport system permease protein